MAHPFPTPAQRALKSQMIVKNLTLRLAASTVTALLLGAGLMGCTSVGLGLTFPIPGIGSIGVGVDNQGHVTGGVNVGTGGVSVGVGGTAQLPHGNHPAHPEGAASAPQ